MHKFEYRQVGEVVNSILTQASVAELMAQLNQRAMEAALVAASNENPSGAKFVTPLPIAPDVNAYSPFRRGRFGKMMQQQKKGSDRPKNTLP